MTGLYVGQLHLTDQSRDRMLAQYRQCAETRLLL
jgi:hypothetical protein